MSQNFDLLNQIEAEYKSQNGRATVASTVAPTVLKPSEYVLHDPPSEDLLRMAQAVFLSGSNATPHVVVICGVDEENGSSQICSELGRILALSSERSVCLVDGDVRARRLSKSLDIHSAHTRSTSVLGICVQRAAHLWIAAPDALDPRDEAVLASPDLLRLRLADLRKAFDFVIIDAPGVNTQSDAAALGQLADAAILVIEASVTRKQAALRAKAVLGSMNVRLLGTVLNNRTYPIPEQLYRKL